MTHGRALSLLINTLACLCVLYGLLWVFFVTLNNIYQWVDQTFNTNQTAGLVTVHPVYCVEAFPAWCCIAGWFSLSFDHSKPHLDDIEWSESRRVDCFCVDASSNMYMMMYITTFAGWQSAFVIQNQSGWYLMVTQWEGWLFLCRCIHQTCTWWCTLRHLQADKVRLSFKTKVDDI